MQTRPACLWKSEEEQSLALCWKDEDGDRAGGVRGSMDVCSVRKLAEAGKSCIVSSVTGSTKHSQHIHQSLLYTVYEGRHFIIKYMISDKLLFPTFTILNCKLQRTGVYFLNA